MKKIIMMLVGVGMTLNSAVATPAVSDISARQRYPWNGLVDLKFTITGESGMKYDTSFTAKDMVGGTNVAMKTIRKSDGTTAAEKEKLLPGTYNWIWDAAADLPDGFKCERMTVTGTADLSAFPYTVKFNANGGTGTMANQSFTYGTAQNLKANAFTRNGYSFVGWATGANGAKVYSDKQSVNNLTTTANGTVNLYAVWKEKYSKVQLWAGGPYWATTNIGANEPWESGYYFWWGDTVGYKWENGKWIASDGSQSNYSFIDDNAFTCGMSVSALEYSEITLNHLLRAEYDAASMKWGSSWRMPTHQEQCDLIDKCDWSKTTMNGVVGYVFRGRGEYAHASIFLPCAGHGSETLLSSYGTHGYYSSSAPQTEGWERSLASWGMLLNDNNTVITNYNLWRYQGSSIRPVQSSTK